MQRVPLRLLVACVAAGGCSGQITTTTVGLVGNHEVEGTYSVNSFQPAGLPAGMNAPQGYRSILTVTALDDSEHRISNEKDGLSFIARLQGNELNADGAVVTISPTGNAHAASWQSMALQRFRWNIETGMLQSTDDMVIDLPHGGLSRGFIDARVKGVADASRHWVHYSAATNYPWDFPHGAECVLGGEGTAEGFVGLSYGATPSDLRIYMQGVGCWFLAQREDGDRFGTTNTDCPLDAAMSVVHLGILSWWFESFSLDLAARHLSFLARATRTRDDGTLVDLCLKVDSVIDGELPL